MQSLATFFDDNKPLAYAATVAAILVLVIVVFVLYRLLFGRRLRTAAGGRARQPRLGIVDAYDLDRQRQLVLVRRDNVEHLIMIGGPTDVVIESAIVRAQMSQMAREKDGIGPVIGSITSPPLPAGPQLPPLAPVAASSGLAPPLPARTEPSLGTPPSGTPQVQGVAAGRERPPSRLQSTPEVPSPSGLPPGALPTAEPGPQPLRVAPTTSIPPRPSSLPPRPTQAPLTAQASAPNLAGSAQNPGAAPPNGSAPTRPPLPTRPAPRPPLPPRPSLSSSLPPRPPRPLPGRAETPPRLNPADAPADGSPASTTPSPAIPVPATAPPVTAPNVGVEPEPREARGPNDAPAQRIDTRQPPAAPAKTETLESLEEEMAKLLGRPSPRREG